MIALRVPLPAREHTNVRIVHHLQACACQLLHFTRCQALNRQLLACPCAICVPSLPQTSVQNDTPTKIHPVPSAIKEEKQWLEAECDQWDSIIPLQNAIQAPLARLLGPDALMAAAKAF